MESEKEMLTDKRERKVQWIYSDVNDREGIEDLVDSRSK